MRYYVLFYRIVVKMKQGFPDYNEDVIL